MEICLEKSPQANFLPGCWCYAAMRFCFAKLRHESLSQKYGGPCWSESYIAPLLKQRFAQLATGAIYDSSPSGYCIREEHCRRFFILWWRRAAGRFCFARLWHESQWRGVMSRPEGFSKRPRIAFLSASAAVLLQEGGQSG